MEYFVEATSTKFWKQDPGKTRNEINRYTNYAHGLIHDALNALTHLTNTPNPRNLPNHCLQSYNLQLQTETVLIFSARYLSTISKTLPDCITFTCICYQCTKILYTKTTAWIKARRAGKFDVEIWLFLIFLYWLSLLSHFYKLNLVLHKRWAY